MFFTLISISTINFPRVSGNHILSNKYTFVRHLPQQFWAQNSNNRESNDGGRGKEQWVLFWRVGQEFNIRLTFPPLSQNQPLLTEDGDALDVSDPRNPRNKVNRKVTSLFSSPTFLSLSLLTVTLTDSCCPWLVLCSICPWALSPLASVEFHIIPADVFVPRSIWKIN